MSGSVGSLVLTADATLVDERRVMFSAPASGPFSNEARLSVVGGSVEELIADEHAIQESGDAAPYLDRIVQRAHLVMARQPSSSRARTNYGLALFAIGSLADAEAEFAQALRLDPQDYLATASLARVWAAQDRLDEAQRFRHG